MRVWYEKKFVRAESLQVILIYPGSPNIKSLFVLDVSQNELSVL